MIHHSWSRTTHLTAFCLALALLAAPCPAAAQRLVVSYAPDGGVLPALPFVTQSIDLGAGAVEWTEPFAMNGTPVVAHNGRHVLYQRPATPTGPLLLFARDLVANVTVPLPFDFEPRLAHPTQLAFFGLTDVHSTGFGRSAGTLARLDVAGLQTAGGCPADTTVVFDLSADAGTMASLCESGDIVLLNATSGQTIRTLVANAATPIVSLRWNSDATGLLVTRRNGTVTNEIALLDAVSGAALSTTTMGPAQAGCVISGISPDRTLAVVGCTWAAAPSSVVGEARVLDVGALAVRPALMTGLIPSTAVFSPDNRAVFLTSAHRLGFGTLNQHDVATGAVTLSSGIITPGRFTVAFAPLAPALGATVVGTRLDLSWTLPPHSPAATRYALEAGTAPGRTDIGTVTVGPGQTLSIPSVPPGAYLVRVRAANATGVGTASNEVSVTVP